MDRDTAIICQEALLEGGSLAYEFGNFLSSAKPMGGRAILHVTELCSGGGEVARCVFSPLLLLHHGTVHTVVQSITRYILKVRSEDAGCV